MSNNYEALSEDTIRKALFFISANDDRDTWLRAGMAIKSELGDNGFDMWNDWSSTASNYDDKAVKHVWKSISGSGGRGIGTLIQMAIAEGFKFEAEDQAARIDPAALAARNAEREAARKVEEAEKKKAQKAAAMLADVIFESATYEDADAHPYLVRKGIKAHGAKVGNWPLRRSIDGEVYGNAANTLLIPIMRGDKIHTLQGIFATLPKGYTKEKAYLKDGNKAGGYFLIGALAAGATVIVCEGYATGVTLHEATGHCVAVAFDAPNIPAVLKYLMGANPECHFLVAADNDQFHADGKPNDGVKFAREAIQGTRAKVAIPKFSDLDGQPTDFDDLRMREGIAEVKRQIDAVLNPPRLQIAPPDTLVANPEPIDIDSIDTLTPFPDTTLKQQPMQTIQNIVDMLRRLKTRVRYNIIKKNVEVLIPGASYTLDNEDNVAIAILESWSERFGLGTSRLSGNILAIADNHAYNPVAQWITSKPWDGVCRLQEFFNTVTPTNDIRTRTGKSLKECLLRRWMLSAIAGIFQPKGVSAHGVLTFVSDQNLGKTSWFKSLAPADIDVIQDGLTLNPADKDSVMQCVSNWLVELGELDATFRKADIAQLKSFITKDRDTLRRPYARKESRFARRTVFFASVNETNFLHDTTGNRRFWTIECKSINFAHGIDMQQVWAELYLQYVEAEKNHQQGMRRQWTLDADEMDALNDNNRDFEAVNPVHDAIDRLYDWDTPKTLWNIAMSATEIITQHANDKPNKADANAAASYVTKQYGVEWRKVGKNRDKRWMMPPKARHRLGDNDNDRPL